MASIRKKKKLLKLQERELAIKESSIQTHSMYSSDASCSSNEMINSLVDINSMLCQSAFTAQKKFADDPDSLINIIINQNVTLEMLLKKNGIRIVRSKRGQFFDPEIMEALTVYEPTSDKELDSKIAYSVTPGYWKENQNLKCEVVQLFIYKE